MARRLWQSLLILCIAVITLFLIRKVQEIRRFAGYEEVVRSVQNGDLRPDAQGDIRLPSGWRGLTENGHVYQYKDKTSGLVLLFPTDVDSFQVDWGDGKVTDQRQIAGYIYCSGPPPENGGFSFADMEGVQVMEQGGLPPHWLYAEPFYSW